MIVPHSFVSVPRRHNSRTKRARRIDGAPGDRDADQVRKQDGEANGDGRAVCRTRTLADGHLEYDEHQQERHHHFVDECGANAIAWVDRVAAETTGEVARHEVGPTADPRHGHRAYPTDRKKTRKKNLPINCLIICFLNEITAPLETL